MTKAANIKKRRAHRGRPADEDCEREPNGRKRRSRHPKEQGDIRMVAIEARMRHYDLPEKLKLKNGKVLEGPEIAALEDAGTILGVLWLQGHIKWAQRKAGDELHEWHRDKEAALQTPDSLAKGAPGGFGGDASQDYVEWATAMVGRWEAGKQWLLSRGAWSVFAHCVLEGDYPTSEELETLRKGLGYAAKRLGY